MTRIALCVCVCVCIFIPSSKRRDLCLARFLDLTANKVYTHTHKVVGSERSPFLSSRFLYSRLSKELKEERRAKA